MIPKDIPKDARNCIPIALRVLSPSAFFLFLLSFVLFLTVIIDKPGGI